MSLNEPSITRESTPPLSLLPAEPTTVGEVVAGENPAGASGALAVGAIPKEPGSHLIVQPPGLRTIFIREGEWKSGTKLPSEELTVWLRRRRRRELCLLALLNEHRYFTSEQLHALFWPGRTRRAANLLLRWLATEMELVMRWPQLEPVVDRRSQSIRGWRRRSWLYLLTERGAALLAHDRRTDPQALIKRSYFTAEYCYRLEHDLESNGFWVGLAAASRELSDQGLYHWVGDDAMRRNYEELGLELRPDGWGRYLTASQEVLFSLEWDRGSEAPQRLSRKARAYVGHAAGRAGEHNHVLFVAPGPTREATIRAAIARVLPASCAVRFWTSHAGLLRERGPLGQAWQEVAGKSERRLRLPELPGPRRSERRVEDCIGKPSWWERRPGGGGGA